jgi:co-chaperonin GroES (HSP10)
MVLVKLRDEPESENAIIIVRAARQPTTRATVLAIGEEVRDVTVGALVVISRLQGIEIAGGALLLPESAVLATEPMQHEMHRLPMTAECLSDELLEDDAQ